MMAERINPLDYPIIFTAPEYTTLDSAWLEHTPFAMFLIEALKPKTFVELGTYTGCSYCAFCQAVKAQGTGTRCYAVDTWEGDSHAGFYASSVLDTLKAVHDPEYSDFSVLMRTTFDEAAAKFEAGSIDLLHIDGLHTYEAVKHDFETWLPKMSRRGVVIFHDSNVYERGFGVYKLIAELKAQYPVFEFMHGSGLAVMAIGEETPPELEGVLQASPPDTAALRELFSVLGQSHRVPLLRHFWELCQSPSAKIFFRMRVSAKRLLRRP